jgi:hypothetical protein
MSDSTANGTNGATKRHTPEVVDKVEKLIALATDNANEEEARNAAVAAVKLINDAKLHLIPEADLENVLKAVDGAKRANERANGRMLIGLIIGAVVAKKVL